MWPLFVFAGFTLYLLYQRRQFEREQQDADQANEAVEWTKNFLAGIE
jgi:hypothetical protein